jgi:DNA-directed RNA polymerase specialized sigma24 family protein
VTREPRLDDRAERDDVLAWRFEELRPHLNGVAYRTLGSVAEADDAVQATWGRLHRTDTSDVDNFAGSLTTVVARVSLKLLRTRRIRARSPSTATR